MRGVRVPEDNLEQIERGLSAPGSQQVNAEDLLAELVRLVKSPGFALERRPPPVEIAPEQDLPASEPTLAPEGGALESALNALFDKPQDTVVVAVEPPEPRKPDISSSKSSNGIGLATRRRSGAWTLGASALVLVGVAVIGSTYGLEQIMSKPPQAPPSTAAAETPAIAPPRSNSSVAASSDAGVTPPKDIAQPVEGKVVSPEERPVDLNAHNSVEKAPPSQDLASTGVEVAQPAVPVAGAPPAAPLNAPTMAEPVAASPAAASQSLRFQGRAYRFTSARANRDADRLRHGLRRGRARERSALAAGQACGEGRDFRQARLRSGRRLNSNCPSSFQVNPGLMSSPRLAPRLPRRRRRSSRPKPRSSRRRPRQRNPRRPPSSQIPILWRAP